MVEEAHDYEFLIIHMKPKMDELHQYHKRSWVLIKMEFKFFQNILYKIKINIGTK